MLEGTFYQNKKYVSHQDLKDVDKEDIVINKANLKYIFRRYSSVPDNTKVDGLKGDFKFI